MHAVSVRADTTGSLIKQASPAGQTICIRSTGGWNFWLLLDKTDISTFTSNPSHMGYRATCQSIEE